MHMYQNSLYLVPIRILFHTNLTLKICIDPSILYFHVNTYLQPISFDFLGKSTEIQVWFDIIESISSLITSNQNDASLDGIASLNIFGSHSILSKMSILLITIYTYFLQQKS